MSDYITNTELSTIRNAFSIKNFITDLPKMLNKAFETIYRCITDFYSPDSNKVKCANVEAGYIDATTVVTQNLTFKGSNGQVYRYDDIATKIAELEERINAITPITMEQLNELDPRAMVVVENNSIND